MFCPSCGGGVETSAKFCPTCGAAIPVAPPASPIPYQTAQPHGRKRSAGKFIIIGCALLILIGVGIAVAAFFGIRYALKSSDAAKVAVQALRQSSSARQALGDITDVGTPMGSIQSSFGGSGNASLSMSVIGTKTSGEYYATLLRRNGQWMLTSGRIELADGRSINIEASALGLSIGGGRSAAGRQLKTDLVDTNSWKEINWPQQGITLRVPSNWIQKETSQRQLDIRAGEIYSSTYLMANAWLWERDLASEEFLAADVKTASEKLKNGVIAGYAVRDIGGVSGLLTISSIGDRLVATWNAIVPAGEEQKLIDISLGAPVRDFGRLEPVFNAVFDSVQFNSTI